MAKSKKPLPKLPEGFEAEIDPALAKIKEAQRHPLPHVGPLPRRGPWVWDDERVDPEIRDAFRPEFSDQEMAEKTAAERLSVERERAQRVSDVYAARLRGPPDALFHRVRTALERSKTGEELALFLQTFLAEYIKSVARQAIEAANEKRASTGGVATAAVKGTGLAARNAQIRSSLALVEKEHGKAGAAEILGARFKLSASQIRKILRKR